MAIWKPEKRSRCRLSHLETPYASGFATGTRNRMLDLGRLRTVLNLDIQQVLTLEVRRSGLHTLHEVHFVVDPTAQFIWDSENESHGHGCTTHPLFSNELRRPRKPTTGSAYRITGSVTYAIVVSFG